MHEYNPTDYDTPMELDAHLVAYNDFNNAIVVLSNLIARATTKWTLQESKLFLLSVSKVKSRDNDNWVTLKKKDIIKALEMNEKDISKLRELFKRMMMKSYMQLENQYATNKNDIEWQDGFLITKVRSTKKTISVKFDSEYMPLLDNLVNHYTSFYLSDVLSMQSMSSYKLYVYLTSWHSKEYAVQNRIIYKRDIAKVFGLKEDAYWRNYGTERAKFDYPKFEQYCLNAAINEINELNSKGQCDMRVLQCTKEKDGHFVLGYNIKYTYTTKDGYIKTCIN